MQDVLPGNLVIVSALICLLENWVFGAGVLLEFDLQQFVEWYFDLLLNSSRSALHA